jgi:hypothetical protein
MKLTLRAARKLETKITKHLEENPVSFSAKVRVSAEASEVEKTLDEAKVKVQNEISDRMKLLEIKYSIRQKIANANHQSGINDLMTKKVMAEQKVSHVKAILGTTPRMKKEEIQDTLKLGQTKLANGVTSRYGEDAAVSANLSIFKEEDMDSYKKEKVSLAKEIENIEDKLTELNFTTKIEVEEDGVKLLQKHNLV